MWSGFTGDRIYLDANIIIYAFEARTRWTEILRELLSDIDENAIAAFTSELTLMEVLVLPFKQQALDVVEQYERVLSSTSPIQVVPVDRIVLRSAALMRAELGLKFADAIHVATARSQACDFFLSNDARVRMPSGLKWLTLEEVERGL